MKLNFFDDTFQMLRWALTDTGYQVGVGDTDQQVLQKYSVYVIGALSQNHENFFLRWLFLVRQGQKRDLLSSAKRSKQELT